MKVKIGKSEMPGFPWQMLVQLASSCSVYLNQSCNSKLPPAETDSC